VSAAWIWLAAAAAAPAEAQPEPDEARWKAPRIVGQDCRRATEEEIVVCGRRDPDRYRLKDLGPTATGDEPRRLGMNLADNVRAEVEPLTVIRPDGLVDKRVMINIKTKF
jgi:hypothetical protein